MLGKGRAEAITDSDIANLADGLHAIPPIWKPLPKSRAMASAGSMMGARRMTAASDMLRAGKWNGYQPGSLAAPKPVAPAPAPNPPAKPFKAWPNSPNRHGSS